MKRARNGLRRVLVSVMPRDLARLEALARVMHRDEPKFPVSAQIGAAIHPYIRDCERLFARELFRQKAHDWFARGAS